MVEYRGAQIRLGCGTLPRALLLGITNTEAEVGQEMGFSLPFLLPPPFSLLSFLSRLSCFMCSRLYPSLVVYRSWRSGFMVGGHSLVSSPASRFCVAHLVLTI